MREPYKILLEEANEEISVLKDQLLLVKLIIKHHGCSEKIDCGLCFLNGKLKELQKNEKDKKNS